MTRSFGFDILYPFDMIAQQKPKINTDESGKV